MSKSFNVYPSKKTIVKCSDLVRDTIKLFNVFCERAKIKNTIEISTREVMNGSEITDNPKYIANNEKCYTILKINDIGEIFIFYNRHLDLDVQNWKEYIDVNPNAKMIEQSIYANLQLGYFWTVKKTMGQPFWVELLYGCVAISIARRVEGFIFSDDGAWEIELLPMDYQDFEVAYFNTQKFKNEMFIAQMKSSLDYVDIQ